MGILQNIVAVVADFMEAMMFPDRWNAEMDRRRAEQRRQLDELYAKQQNKAGWTDRLPGVTSDGKVVTFREGLGENEGHTLIADGDLSARAFKRGHNHYGQDREGGGGRVEDHGGDRGHYTGPGH